MYFLFQIHEFVIPLFQFVCFGGSPNRMQKFAGFMVGELREQIPTGMQLYNISHGSDRYVLYKVGPVLSISVRRPLIFVVLYIALQGINFPRCVQVQDMLCNCIVLQKKTFQKQ